MIRASPHFTSDGSLKSLDLSLDTEGILELSEILQRALGTQEPGKMDHWFELSDKLPRYYKPAGAVKYDLPVLTDEVLPICEFCGGPGLLHHHKCRVITGEVPE